MAYTKQRADWIDWPNITTQIRAVDLDGFETGIYDAHAATEGGATTAHGRVYYVATDGSDSNNGKSWGLPFRNIQKAVDVIEAQAAAGGRIYVGMGDFTETVTISQGELHLDGVGVGSGGSAKTRIKAPSVNANCLTLDSAPRCVITDILTHGGSSLSWEGAGIYVNDSDQCFIQRCRHRGDDNSVSATTGGRGLVLDGGSESVMVQHYMFSGCRIGIDVVDASCGGIYHVIGSTCYQAIRVGTGGGGHLFFRTKCVEANVADAKVLELLSGNCTFIETDWGEAFIDPAKNQIYIGPNANDGVFIFFHTSADTVLNIDGSRNQFIGLKLQDDLTVAGSLNRFSKVSFSGTPTVSITGNNNVLEDTTGTVGSLTLTNGSRFIQAGARGTGTIASGATTATVTHLNGATPLADQIRISPTSNPTNDPGHIWVDTIGATTFKVNCRTDPGTGGLTFSWQVN